MQYFPQLLGATSSQFPLRRRRNTKTILNECLDGRRIRLADSGSETVNWLLQLEDITDLELTALEEFVGKVEGRLGTFIFLDPSGNLLAWSEGLGHPVWERSTFITVTAEIEDPSGSLRASRITNRAPAGLQILQTINAPGWFHYCFSLHVRGAEGTHVNLIRQAGSAAAVNSYELKPDWNRIASSGRLQSTDDAVGFGLELSPGLSMDVFGLQVEAQAGASIYKKTLQSGAIYPNTRLVEDALVVTKEGPDQNSCRFGLIARP